MGAAGLAARVQRRHRPRPRRLGSRHARRSRRCNPGTGGGGTNPGTGGGGSNPGTNGGGSNPTTGMLDDSATVPGPATLRRLTLVEYQNTVRDLLGIEASAVAIKGLPSDQDSACRASSAAAPSPPAPTPGRS